MISFIWKCLKILGLATVGVIGIYTSVERWGVQVAQSVVAPQIEKVMAVRNADYQHINDRFDRLEKFQDKRFDKLETLIKEN